ncbi:DUF418 domain-containing protein [Mesorhizobium ciceri]|uniref:DUF418 domain-containing protein n=1 Tax=Mesorhizobium TaxID=68287 RepID=UPI0009EDE43F|nr:DUF418 domain-containing protein [Mesorhizobium ciceri]
MALPHRILESGSRDGRPAARLIGIDLARGLAVFGMCAVHVGPGRGDGLAGRMMEFPFGRSSVLFAVLTGFSLILIAGRNPPKSALAGRQAIAKIAIRALILLALGEILAYVNAPVSVILAYYGVCFLLVLPLCRLSAQRLGLLAAATALVLPQVRFLLLKMFGSGRSDPEVFTLLVSGTYPALTWVPLLIAGMAIARFDLRTRAMHLRLGVAGVALAVLGFGGSWLALHLMPGVSAELANLQELELAPQPWWWLDLDDLTTSWLWIASPHSETTFWIFGSAGCAMIIVAACSLAMDALPFMRKLVSPIIAVGSMPLTAYLLHILGIYMLGRPHSLSALFGLIVVVSAFAVLWLRLFQRGPMEALMGSIVDRATRRPLSTTSPRLSDRQLRTPKKANLTDGPT